MTRRPEVALERQVLLALGSQADVWIQPNPVGQGFYGALASQLCGDCRAASSRFRLTYGLGVGSPDLVGAAGGVFFGLELKSDTGRVRPEQATWHEAFTKRGGVVAVVRTVAEAADVAEQARRIDARRRAA